MEKCNKCNGTGFCDINLDVWKPQAQAIGPQVLDAKGPSAPTGSTAFIFEISALRGENKRLVNELDKARTELAHMRPVVEAVGTYLGDPCVMNRNALIGAWRVYRIAERKEQPNDHA